MHYSTCPDCGVEYPSLHRMGCYGPVLSAPIPAHTHEPVVDYSYFTWCRICRQPICRSIVPNVHGPWRVDHSIRGQILRTPTYPPKV